MKISTKTAVRGLIAACVVAIAALTFMGCSQPSTDNNPDVPTPEEQLEALKANATNWVNNTAKFSYDEFGDHIELNFSQISSTLQSNINSIIQNLPLGSTANDVYTAVLGIWSNYINNNPDPDNPNVAPPFTNTAARAATNAQIALTAARSAQFAEPAAARSAKGIGV